MYEVLVKRYDPIHTQRKVLNSVIRPFHLVRKRLHKLLQLGEQLGLLFLYLLYLLGLDGRSLRELDPLSPHVLFNHVQKGRELLLGVLFYPVVRRVVGHQVLVFVLAENVGRGDGVPVLLDRGEAFCLPIVEEAFLGWFDRFLVSASEGTVLEWVEDRKIPSRCIHLSCSIMLLVCLVVILKVN